MITRDIFESVCPSAVMPTDELFNRISDYVAQGEEYARHIMGPLWDAADPSLDTVKNRVVCLHAYDMALPHLDIVLTETGFGVVNNQNVVPASADRVNRLRQQVRDSRDDAVDDLLDGCRGQSGWDAWATSIGAFTSLVWNAHEQLPVMGLVDAHRTKLVELRPQIHAAEEILKQRISEALHAELCDALMDNDATTAQTVVVNKALLFIGAYVTGDRTARWHMSKLVEFLEKHLTDFQTYESSSAHAANAFIPYENKKDDTTYFFG
jgi:hypothetical protein